MTLVDPVDPDAAGTLASLIEACGYVVPGSDEELNTISKSNAASTIATVEIVQFDATGAEKERWSLKNPFVKSIKFGDLDYENDDLTQIELEFRYDWAVMKDAEGNEHFSSAGA